MVAAAVRIWQMWRNEAFDLPQLTLETRRILGVRKSCTTDPEEIARLLQMKPQRVQAILAAVRRSQVREVLLYGLPIRASAYVPEGTRIVCRKCRSQLASVPCIRCGLEAGETIGEPDAPTAKAPPVSPYSTTTIPGSGDKIAAMRFRAAMGYQVFHDDDIRV